MRKVYTHVNPAVQLHLFPTEKFCPQCGIPQPIENFNKNANRKDGLQYSCKTCCAEYAHTQLEKRRISRLKKKEDKEYWQEVVRKRRERRHSRAEQLKKHYRKRYQSDPSHRKRLSRNTKQWEERHPEKVREKRARTDARRRKAIIGQVNYKSILHTYGHWCHICNQPILPHQKLEFDHVIPLLPKLGEPKGTHTQDNIRPTHKVCNARKSNRRVEDLTSFDRRGPDVE